MAGHILRLSCIALVFLYTSNTLSAQDSLYLKSIMISGNKKTRTSIIIREITLAQHRWYGADELKSAAERSRSNLMNTALFNFVDISQSVQHDTATIHILLAERWYTWPSPIFELVDPNFNTWWETRELKRTSYGFQLTQYNVRGRNETLRMRLKVGYNEQLSLAYEIPFLDRKKQLGFALFAHYFQNYQVNYGSSANKRLFYTDPGGLAREEYVLSSRLQFRKANYGRHYVLIEYYNTRIAPQLVQISPEYLGDATGRRRALELMYQFVYDKRDYSPYPLVGTYFSVSLSNPAIDLVRPQSDRIWQFYAQTKKYYSLTPHLYFAFSATAKHTWFRKLPYYFQRGLGYNDFIRGYEYYIMDAQSFAALKSNWKLQLLKRREIKLAFIKNERFNRLFFASYLNLNFDAGYACDRLYAAQNPLSNRLLLGGGLGLDLISFYDIIIRCEYSLNKLGESGFFLHFSKPI